jgi:hypothetical protein
MKCREEEWQSTIGDMFILVSSGEGTLVIRRPDAKGIDKFLPSSRNSFKPVIGEVSEGFPIDKFLTCTYRYGGR